VRCNLEVRLLGIGCLGSHLVLHIAGGRRRRGGRGLGRCGIGRQGGGVLDVAGVRPLRAISGRGGQSVSCQLPVAVALSVSVLAVAVAQATESLLVREHRLPAGRNIAQVEDDRGVAVGSFALLCNQ
jgi:hypothetical protein